MEQLDFMHIETPAARSTDPITSHEAAQSHTRSGARRGEQAVAIAAVRAQPGQTSLELAEICGLDRYMLARRLPECETAGEVHRGEIRRCCASGRKALTWWPGKAN